MSEKNNIKQTKVPKRSITSFSEQTINSANCQFHFSISLHNKTVFTQTVTELKITKYDQFLRLVNTFLASALLYFGTVERPRRNSSAKY